ncbi:MAG: phosphoribosylaminoimidazolesuccinocarboxamide synthase [Gammaproteobacteria bacterium]
MSTSQNALYKADLSSLPLLYSGKVRDIYEIDAEHMMIVTTDRLSAFDVILPDPIPGKGVVLTTLSNYWFARMTNIVPNHLTGRSLTDVIFDPGELRMLEGRAVIVRKLKPLPVEAIVRGYIIGSSWKDYLKSGAVCDINLPAGLKQAEKLPRPIFTPSTKADIGDHDINIGFDKVVEKIGKELAEQVKDISLKIYQDAAVYAINRGIIIADTKFEVGMDEEGKLVLIDEILTPDSSRFWPADSYQVGTSPPSFDKQYVRDYLETLNWDKSPPAPRLPEKVIKNTAAKYREAQERLIN